MANGLVRELEELKPREADALPARDVRARTFPATEHTYPERKPAT